jgi:O-antigen/teichoic acid export membrane protein
MRSGIYSNARTRMFQTHVVISALAQAYALVIGMVMLPILLRLLGPEAYGLVALYLIAQTWFQFFDFGFGAALGRETARQSTGTSKTLDLWRLLRSLEAGYLLFGLLAAGIGAAGAGWLATNWLKLDATPSTIAENAIALLAVAVPLRWCGTLYTNVLIGLERHFAVAIYMALSATARFALSVPIVLWTDQPLIAFFAYQVALAAFEAAMLAALAYRWMPTHANEPLQPSWSALQNVKRFSGALAGVTILWFSLTQIDKIVLSNALPLADFGKFALASTLAGGLLLIVSPFAQPLMPRLTRMLEEGRRSEALLTYLQTSRWVALAVIPTTCLIAIFPEQILWVWTGNLTLANETARVLQLYAISNGIAAIGSTAYFLQYASGNLRLHLMGHLVIASLGIPAIFIGASYAGPIGTGLAWFTISSTYLLVWIPIVHRRFDPHIHGRWLAGTFIAPTVGAGVVGIVARALTNGEPISRMTTGLHLVLIGLLMTVATLLLGRLTERRSPDE